MDFYNSSLLKNLAQLGVETFLFSNVIIPATGVQAFAWFHNMGVPKILAVFNNFFCFLRSLFFCRRKKVQWLILHLFRGGLFDLVTMGIARLMGFRIILIVHDVISLDTVALPATRNFILKHFTHTKIVHNPYSKKILAGVIDEKHMGNVKIIPHGNFIELAVGPASPIRSISGWIPEPEKRYLLFFGQVKKVKGIDILLQAMTQPGHDFQLILAGQDRDDSLKTYADFIRANFLEKRVHVFNRFITNEERDFLFRCCEAVVLPYRRIYQSGVLLMAMSYGKPVLASDLEPNKDLIRHGENGLLFKDGDSQSLAGLLNQASRDGEILKSLGEEAFRTVSISNNWITISKLYLEILRG